MEQEPHLGKGEGAHVMNIRGVHDKSATSSCVKDYIAYEIVRAAINVA